ncbi:hypothetical protein GW17_00022998 [Ensete ventricosum]|nr:hypothetical protein GW17_00022998 [Ensete ventricosum]
MARPLLLLSPTTEGDPLLTLLTSQYSWQHHVFLCGNHTHRSPPTPSMLTSLLWHLRRLMIDAGVSRVKTFIFSTFLGPSIAIA